MARRRSWVESWKEQDNPRQFIVAALGNANDTFQRSPTDQDDRDTLMEQSSAIAQVQYALEAVIIGVSRNMYASGWSLRGIAQALETNHAGVASWLEHTGDRPRP